MTSEVERFAEAIGAVAPEPGTELHRAFRSVFKRPNYFLFDGLLLIVKISRSNRPFWGLSKKIIDFANSLDDYLVVLLTTENEGWYFKKTGVNSRIRNLQWKLNEAQGQYKVNYALPDANAFYSSRQFLGTALRKADSSNS